MLALEKSLSTVVLVALIGTALVSCGQTAGGSGGIRVSKASVGRDWPFDGVTEGTIYCDPDHPSRALFHVTAADNGAKEYVGKTWAISSDEAYPLPPRTLWNGALSKLSKLAPSECRDG
jgi:hypothetical protein